MIMKAENIDINCKKIKRLVKKMLEYRNCIKRSGDKIGTLIRHYDISCGPMSCVPTREDGVPEFLIKLLYCRAVA